jgi:hypothetical protein
MKIEMLAMMEVCDVLGLAGLLIVVVLVASICWLWGRGSERNERLKEASRVKAQHDHDLAKAEDKADQDAREELAKAHKDAIAALGATHAKELELLKGQHENALKTAQEMRSELGKNGELLINTLKEQHVAQVQNLKEAQEQAIEHLTANHVREVADTKRLLESGHAEALRKNNEDWAEKFTQSNEALDAKHKETLESEREKGREVGKAEWIGKPVPLHTLPEARYNVLWWEQKDNLTFLAVFQNVANDELSFVDCGVPMEAFPEATPFVVEHRDKWFTVVPKKPAEAASSVEVNSGAPAPGSAT